MKLTSNSDVNCTRADTPVGVRLATVRRVGIISWVVWGFFVGLIARAVKPGRQPIGCLWTMALGIAGSLIGGFLATQVLHIADADEFDLGSFVIAIVASVVLLALWEAYERRRAAPPPPAGR